MVRQVARVLLRGTVHRPFPDSEFQLFYDGYRNIGLGANIASFEFEERRFVREILIRKRPKTIWDIGANIGVWSLFFTTVCSPETEIRCFEPDPDNLKLLRLNMRKNRIGNWIIRPLAASDRECTATFYSDPVCGSTGSLSQNFDFIGKHYGVPREEFRVEVTTVDSEIARGAPPPQFMKIDVEGYELEVLSGALRTLSEHRPLLILETTPGSVEISSFFRGIEYRLLDLMGKPIGAPLFNTIAVPREEDLGNLCASSAPLRELIG